MKMRIGLVAYGLDRFATGIGRYSIELTRGLLGLRHDIEIFLFTAGGGAAELRNDNIVQVALPKCERYFGFVTWGNYVLRDMAKKYNLDIVHDLTGVAPLFLVRDVVKTVITLHDVFPWSFPGHNTIPDTFVYRFLLPNALKRINQIITPSSHSKKDIIKYLNMPDNKVNVIHHGVSEKYQPVGNIEINRIRLKYNLPQAYILYVGSIERRKNILNLIRACKLYWQTGCNIPLVIVGPKRWQYEQIINNLEEEDVSGHVKYLGYLPSDDLPAIYSAATLFVFPTLYEGFGFPVLEAMACGVPVICSKVASLLELAGNAVIFVDPNNVNEIAASIMNVLSSKDTQMHLAKLGIDRAKQFRWKNTSETVVDVYEKLF